MYLVKSIFKNLLGKSRKRDSPEKLLIKKTERLKPAQDIGSLDAGSTAEGANPEVPGLPGDSQGDMVKKIEELINSKSHQIDANDEAIKEYDIRLNKLDGGLSSVKNNFEDIGERLDKIDETQLELMSLYEVVSSTINPFVGENNPGTAEKVEELEKKFDDLSVSTPTVLSSFREEYDAKFMELQESMNSPVQVEDADILNNETLIEMVSGKVIEQISPLLEMQSQQENETEVQEENNMAHINTVKQKTDQVEGGVKLTHLDNNAESSIVLLNWINFLLEKVGQNNIVEVIKYYIDIDWISEEVGSKMIDYTDGLDYYLEKPTWKLLPDDHVKSLMYIGLLTGQKIDKNIFSKLDLRNNVKDNGIYTVSRL